MPTLALDIAPNKELGCYKVATGGNDCRVYIWLINTKKFNINIRAGLRRHQKSIGAVRFSPQQLLASGDDDGYIYLWKQKIQDSEQLQQQQNEPSANGFLNDDGFEDVELWQHYKVLRGHIEDICDLAWSKDGTFLLSGSVDNSAILWDTTRGTKVWCSDLIKGYVQGVAIDPHLHYMVALSSDRTLRVYNYNDKKIVSATRRMNISKGKYKAFFCDDTVQTFCRRLEFSPDGQFLLAPTCRMVEREKAQQQQQDDEQDNNNKMELDDQPQPPQKQTQLPQKQTNILLVFKRNSFNKPFFSYPIGREVALCARFSPIVYQLRPSSEENFWDVPYRYIFAIATSRSVLIYDSQQSAPIAYVSQIHLARLTDLSWSSDGQMLMISSYDGYTSIIAFDSNEFGDIYTGELLQPAVKETKEPGEAQKAAALQKQAKQEAAAAAAAATAAAAPPPPVQKKPEMLTIRKYLIKRS